MGRLKKFLFLILFIFMSSLLFFGWVRGTSNIKANESNTLGNTKDEESIRTINSYEIPIENQKNRDSAAMLKEQGASVISYIVPRAALPVATKEQNVSTWAELIAAVRDTTIDRINVMANFSSGAALPTISRTLVINGNNHVLGFGARNFNVDSSGKITLSDLEYTGTNTLVSGSGSAIFTNTIKSSDGNSSVLASMDGASVTFDNVDLFFDSTSRTGAVAAKNFFITNQSKVDSNSERFYQITAASNAGAVFKIDAQSKVLLSSMKDTGTGNGGQPIQATRQLDMTVEGAGTELKLRGNGKQGASYTGLINIDADASTINVINEAVLDIYTENTSGINMQSLGGVFNVKNKSLLNIHQTGDNNYDRAAMIRFRLRGNMQFNIEDHSEIKLTKDSGAAPGIRMYGGGNAINVSGGSDFTLINKGTGTPIDPGGNGGNQGILYTNGGSTPDSFVVKDEDSSVDINAANGAAIDAKGLNMTISANTGTYFVARGQTRTATTGIFNAGVLTTNFDSMKYFDFVNTRPGGGLVFDTSAGSEFSSLKSDISVWVAGINDVSGNPMRSFVLADIYLKGVNFSQVSTGTDNEVSTGFTLDGGMPKYSRLNGNNQTAVIDELRTPTNADKYIWGHAGIPEGKHDANRDTFTDEVSVVVGVYDSTNTLLYKTTGTIVEDTKGSGKVSIYGENPRGGVFKLDSQVTGSFFETGQRVRILEAWRGNKVTGKAHISKLEDLIAADQTTVDVTPPTKATVTTTITNATKQISGMSSEDGAKVFVKANDKWIENAEGTLLTTTVKEGKWILDLPDYFTKEDRIDVYLKDTTTIEVQPRYTLPTTYTQEPDAEFGNLNVAASSYSSYTGYHDAIKTTVDQRFSPSVNQTTSDVLPDQPELIKSVVSSGGTTTSVGDLLTYTFVAKNNKAASEPWKNVQVIDVLPEGLSFDSAKHKVTINGEKVGVDKYTYDKDTRTLTIHAGAIAANKEIILSFEVTVDQSAVDKDILNQADAKGESPQEAPFVSGAINPEATHKLIQTTSKAIGLPGGAVFGVLTFVSAPKGLDFGVKTESLNGKTIAEKPTIVGDPLIVSDNRGNLQQWTMTATLLSPLANGDAIFPDAIHYVDGKSDEVITGLSKPIFTHKNTTVGEYNISEEEWVKKNNGFKIELAPGTVNKLGKYKATIQFSLSDTP